jgi:DNA-binding CsgD family transcriptional regulator
MNLLPRERQVLACAERGMSCKETARELGIASNTVRVYRHQAMGKFDTSRIVVAVLSAREKGLL